MPTVASNKFKELLMRKTIDFQNDPFKIILMKKGFAFSVVQYESYDDVLTEEHAAENGYTAGGQTLQGVEIILDNVENVAYATWHNVSWLAEVGPLEAAGAIIYCDIVSLVDRPIVGYIDFNGTLVTHAGGTKTIANIATVVV